MPEVAELLDLEPVPGPATFSTGFQELDELAGGFARGQVWLVTGTPGQGCTTLLTQWAANLSSRHPLRTILVTPRERQGDVVARLVACLGRVPLRDLLAGGYATAEPSRLSCGRRALSGAQLFLTSGRGGAMPYLHEAEDRVVVLDDVDLLAGATPTRIRRAADAGALVIASLPRHLLVQDRHLFGDLDPEWARVADVVLEVRSRRLEEADVDERAGEALISVLKHRRGPTREFMVSFEAHYSRFKPLRR